MVRLWENEILQKALESLISIPLWFDCELSKFLMKFVSWYFNSTMVRLWGNGGLQFSVFVCEFQFHYGSIVSIAREGDIFLTNTFQFHYGSIVRYFNTSDNEWKDRFQFHYGSIVREYMNDHINGTDISIPLWFDCELIAGFTW